MIKAGQRITSLVCFWSVFCGVAAHGALSYWDSNGSTPGAGATPSGTWGVDAFWSTNATGSSSTTAWISANTAVFSAGTDAINPFTVGVSGNPSVSGVVFEEGTVTLAGGFLVMGAGATISVIPPSTSATINSTILGTTLTKSGSGTLFLNGANIYGGLTTISAGVIAIGNNAALGSTSGSTTVSNNAALHISGTLALSEPILLNGTGISNTGALCNTGGSNTISVPVSLQGNVRINSTAGALVLGAGIGSSANNLQMTIGGAGDTILAGENLAGKTSQMIKDGDGVLTLTASCNHLGGTIVSSGKLRLAGSELLRLDSPLVVDGTFDLNGFNESVETMTGGGSVTNGGTLTLGGSSNAPVFGGVISGSTSLVKAGTNTQIFTGNNTYVGVTIVSNGTLRVNGSLAEGSSVLVQAGAILDGLGTIAGPVTVAADGNISSGTGKLTLGNGLDLSGGGRYVWELAANSTNAPGTNFGRLELSGGELKLGGFSTLSIRFNGSATAPDSGDVFWQSNHSWKIISINGGSNPGSTKFFIVENGSYAAGDFSTVVDSDGGLVLNFKLPGPVTNTIDFATASSRAFSGWVRGQSPYRSANDPSFQAMFNMSSPSLMRGIAGGLDADTYDWRIYNSGSKWGATAWGTLVTSLDYLRKCRDTRSEPLLTANMFGGGYTNDSGTMVCEFDNFTNLYNPGGFGTNAVTGSAAQLAADWVRYCNIIVQAYRQGQESLIGNDPNFNPTDNEENLRVYHSVALGGSWNGHDLLLTNGEAAVPKVVWWEIGNEPEVDLATNSTLVTQHVIADKFVYRDRYRVIAQAMKAVDASVWTGPCITTPNPSNEWLGRVAEDTNAPLDFVSIHPYFWLRYVWPNTTNLTAGLKDIGRFLADHARNTALTLSNYGGATRLGTKPAGWFWTTPLIASEYNPVNWDATSEVKRSTASGLGLLEHCFRFADPNRTTNAYQSYLGANYWENPSGVVFLTNVFESLRDFGGDRICENPSPGPQPVPDFGPLFGSLRAYVTQQTNGGNKIHFWGINFSEDTDDSVSFVCTNLPFPVGAIFKRTFGKPSGVNSLTNSAGLGWTAQEVTESVDPSSFTLTVPNASFAILTFQEAAATNRYWDTSKSPGLQGGSGTWSTNLSNMNWSTIPGGESPVFAWADGKNAVFAAPLSVGATVTVTGTVSPRSLTASQYNCTFSGPGTIALGAGGMQITATTQITNTAGNPMLAGVGGITINIPPVIGGTDTAAFNVTNTYTGDTIIALGRLALGSRGAIPNSANIVVSNGATFSVMAKTNGFVLAADQTLAGGGLVSGRVTANGTISPGDSVGTLTFNTNLTLLGRTIMEVSRYGSSVTNDQLVCSNTLTYGGTLIVTNSGPEAPAAGDTFILFTAISHNGSFDNVQLPSLGYGLGWDTNGLGTGVVRVVLTVPYFASVIASGTNLVLNGSNGVLGAEYYLLTSTNVTLPISNWTRLLTNNFGSGGEFSESVAINPIDPTRFYRLQSAN